MNHLRLQSWKRAVQAQGGHVLVDATDFFLLDRHGGPCVAEPKQEKTTLVHVFRDLA